MEKKLKFWKDPWFLGFSVLCFSILISIGIISYIDRKSKFDLGSKSKNFFLDKNGVTCRCPNTKVGERGEINGVEYESVDNELLIKRRDERVDMSRLCTSLVTSMSYLFYRIQFNQPIGNWDVSNVTTMKGMFYCSDFNQPIGNWDVSKVTNMDEMFRSCNPYNMNSFNQTIENWDVSNVTSMYLMFGWSQFNQPIGKWNVGKVLNFQNMFQGSDFNQPIDQWNVNGGIDNGIDRFSGMFTGSQFNQDISSWNLYLQYNTNIDVYIDVYGILGLDYKYEYYPDGYGLVGK